MSFNPFGGFFSIMQILFPLFFLLVLGLIIFAVVRGAKQWSHNNAQPRIPARATVVAKRTQVDHRHHNADSAAHMHTSTNYYATFQYETGDRAEFHVPASAYGLLAEGDRGTLVSQGSRFISFQREQ